MSDATRREPRPVPPEREQEKYWVPEIQDWLSLNEMLYEKQRAKERKSLARKEETNGRAILHIDTDADRPH
jgi:hypothetical protein